MIRSRQILGAAALVACLLAAPARASDEPQVTGEFGDILRLFKLQGEQRDRYIAAAKNFTNDIQEIQRTVQRDIDQVSEEIRKARDKQDIKQRDALEAKLKPLQAKYWQMREQARYKILAVLTPEQQAVWITEQLRVRVERSLARAQPTTEQLVKVKLLCAEEVAAYLKERPEYLKEDPYLRTIGDHREAVVNRAIATVLTDLQKEKLQPPKTGPAGDRGGREIYGVSEQQLGQG